MNKKSQKFELNIFYLLLSLCNSVIGISTIYILVLLIMKEGSLFSQKKLVGILIFSLFSYLGLTSYLWRRAIGLDKKSKASFPWGWTLGIVICYILSFMITRSHGISALRQAWLGSVISSLLAFCALLLERRMQTSGKSKRHKKGAGKNS